MEGLVRTFNLIVALIIYFLTSFILMPALAYVELLIIYKKAYYNSNL
jgi:hypothetical protein